MTKHLLRRGLAAGAALVFSGACVLAADDLPKAETILDKYIEVTGGKAAYLKSHSEIVTGTMEMAAMGVKGSITIYHAEPDLSYTEIEITGIGKVKEGSDGKIAWSLNPMQGPHLKDGEEKVQSLRSAKSNAEVNWRDTFKEVKTEAVEAVDGKDCYKILMTPKEGSSETRYYDKASNILVKTVATAHTPMGDIPLEIGMSDYRKEGDILVPHKLLQKAGGQEIAISVESVKYNSEIPKDKFEPPDEIKALLKK
jgi:zinc protease